MSSVLMPLSKSALCTGALLFFASVGTAGNLGMPPPTGSAARDLKAEFALPTRSDPAASEVAAQLDRLQVGLRARRLGLDRTSATTAWQRAGSTLAAARLRIDAAPPRGVRAFPGRRVSELNRLLRTAGTAAVRVTSPRLDVDEPLVTRSTFSASNSAPRRPTSP